MFKTMLKNICYRIENLFENGPKPKQQFLYTMEIAHSWLAGASNLSQKIIILDYMMSVIREDFKTSVMTTIFYRKEHFKDYRGKIFFPMSYCNENGERLQIYDPLNKEYINISLKDQCVISIPWNRGRMKRAITEIYKREFIYDPYNHASTYYTPLNICHIEGGYHSITAGIGYSKGEITSIKLDISKSFPHLFSDGAYWYNAHTKERLYPVFDYRIAILFELAKLKEAIK